MPKIKKDKAARTAFMIVYIFIITRHMFYVNSQQYSLSCVLKYSFALSHIFKPARPRNASQPLDQ
jgi:hypothetical protein